MKKSYWIQSEQSRQTYKSLGDNIETDICIIGGGITGISIAYYLNQFKIRNVVLEKDRICGRTSGYSTAKITSQHGLFYKYLIDSQGEEFAKKYYEANQEGLQNTKNIIEKEKIDCELKEQSAYVFTQKIDEVQKIKDEVEAVKQIGGEAQYLEANDIEINKINSESNDKIKALCAIEFPHQAQFNSYKYVSKLAEICEIKHTRIFEKSKVIDVESVDNLYEVVLENGVKVRAKYVVIATKYPIINFPGYYFLKMYQTTSNVIVVDPKEKLFEGMYINSEEPTISLRTVDDGDKQLLIVAGFNHKTGAKIDLSNSYEYLEKIAKKMYPQSEVKFRWNTEDTIPLDKIPYIGEFSKFMTNVYVATDDGSYGFKGNLS